MEHQETSSYYCWGLRCLHYEDLLGLQHQHKILPDANDFLALPTTVKQHLYDACQTDIRERLSSVTSTSVPFTGNKGTGSHQLRRSILTIISHWANGDFELHRQILVLGEFRGTCCPDGTCCLDHMTHVARAMCANCCRDYMPHVAWTILQIFVWPI